MKSRTPDKRPLPPLFGNKTFGASRRIIDDPNMREAFRGHLSLLRSVHSKSHGVFALDQNAIESMAAAIWSITNNTDRRFGADELSKATFPSLSKRVSGIPSTSLTHEGMGVSLAAAALAGVVTGADWRGAHKALLSSSRWLTRVIHSDLRDGDRPDWIDFQDGPDAPWIPEPDELDRLMCEEEMAEAIGDAADSLATRRPKEPSAVEIESFHAHGSCPGHRVTLQGRFSQAGGLSVIVPGRNGMIAAETTLVSSAEIVFVIPEGSVSGPIALYDVNAHAQFSGAMTDFMVSAQTAINFSRCASAPLDLPFDRTERPSLGLPVAPTGAPIVELGHPYVNQFHVGNSNQMVAGAGDLIRLSWSVVNLVGDVDVELRRVSSNGPAVERAVEPQGVIELGPLTNDQSDIYEYQLTASNDCGRDTARVYVHAAVRPHLQITGVEVTQGIQDTLNSVPLISDKPTAVRVFVGHGREDRNIIPDVAVQLRWRRTGGAWRLPLLPFNQQSGRMDIPQASTRGDGTTTADFQLPDMAIRNGSIELQARLHADMFGMPSGGMGFNEGIRLEFGPFTFIPQPVRIRYFPVTLAGGTSLPNLSNPPTDDECVDLIQNAARYLPVTIQSVENGGDWWVANDDAPPLVISIPDVGTVSVDIDDVYSPAPTTYDLGANILLEAAGWFRLLDPFDDPDEFWVFLAPADYWGRAHFDSRQLITGFDDLRLAHELGHNMRQRHVTTPNRTAPGGETDFPNNGLLVDNPYRFDASGTAVGPEPLTNSAGNALSDLMSYGLYSRPAPERWKRILDEMG